MNGLVVMAACVCAASGQLLAGPARAFNPSASHQFHAQDEFGQFSFGHAGGPSARTESRNAYGVTQGSYQYVDANGLIQTVNYIADPLNGFRVEGTNLPVAPVANNAAPIFNLVGPAPVEDTPEVAAAKAEFKAAFDAAEAAAAAAPESRRKRQAILPYPYANGLLGAAAPAQIVANIAPAAPVAAPALAYAGAAPIAAPAAREAVLTTVKLNPGHAVFYRVD